MQKELAHGVGKDYEIDDWLLFLQTIPLGPVIPSIPDSPGNPGEPGSP